MSYLWHLDVLSMAFFCTRIIRIIFLHTDLTERTDFIRFIRGAKNILCVIDEGGVVVTGSMGLMG